MQESKQYLKKMLSEKFVLAGVAIVILVVLIIATQLNQRIEGEIGENL